MHTKKLFYVVVGGLALSHVHLNGADVKEDALVNLARVESSIALSLRGNVNTDPRKILLRSATAHALKKANTAIRPDGYRLVVYDYAESEGGTCVDVTLIDREKVAQPIRSEKRRLKDGKTSINFQDDGTIDMGTSYGDESAASRSGFNELVSQAANRARAFLAAAMAKEGFTVADNAWWHFQHKSLTLVDDAAQSE